IALKSYGARLPKEPDKTRVRQSQTRYDYNTFYLIADNGIPLGCARRYQFVALRAMIRSNSMGIQAAWAMQRGPLYTTTDFGGFHERGAQRLCSLVNGGRRLA